MIPLKGTPVRYTDSQGSVWGGIVIGDNGVYPRIAYFDSGWQVSPPVQVRDDTGTTENSWTPVAIAAKFEGV